MPQSCRLAASHHLILSMEQSSTCKCQLARHLTVEVTVWGILVKCINRICFTTKICTGSCRDTSC